MEALSKSGPSVFKPFPHRDPYGMDSLYISPIQEEEIWDLSSFYKADLVSFSFLALRSVVYERMTSHKFSLSNPSLEFRKSMSRKRWELHRLPSAWSSAFPQVYEEKKSQDIPFPLDLNLDFRMDWNEDKEDAGFGIFSSDTGEVFPQILDSLISYAEGRVYLRTSRQSFLYIRSLGSEEKKGLFIQDKESYGFPEFYYYWISRT